MIEIFFTLLFLYLACNALGSFLVLKNQSMIIDALAHSVLLGIVLGFFIVKSLDSPFLIIGASAFGVITVLCVDCLHQSPKINHDTATGLVFPFLFSIAVILISTFLKNTHLDTDIVLMGEIIFVPLNRMSILGMSLPVALIKVIALCAGIYAPYYIFYHPLRVFLFDEIHAKLVNVPVKRIQLITIVIVSLTTVIAFDIVGSFTVICLFIAPNLSVLPFAKSLKQLLCLGSIFVLITTASSVWLAYHFDLTISGTCACISLLLFLLSAVYRKKTS